MSRPNILFLVLDSARVDRVSAYGHENRTTPTLDRLAGESTLFENAYAPAPWTLPSHCSMFTGYVPTQHTVTNGFTDRSIGLPSDIRTAVEKLSADGYDTAGFSNNPWVGELSGLDRGFDEYVEWDLEISNSESVFSPTRTDRLLSRLHTVLGHASRQPLFALKRRFFTSRLVDRAKRWLGQAAKTDRPTFTFLNLMEAHSPYFPPARAFENLGFDTPGPLEPRVLNTKLLAYVLGKSELSPALKRRIYEYYDASLRYQDGLVEELLSALRANGAYDDTLLVVCSDHGKTLGEFDRNEVPPHYLRKINTNVPLLIKSPGQREGERVSRPAELTGLHDHFLDSTGNPRESLCRNDHALIEDFVPHTSRESEPVTRWRALCDGRYRYLRNEDGDEYLFTAGDERTEEGPLKTMREEMESRISSLEPVSQESGDASALDSTVEAQLGDLGYLK